MKRSTQNRIRIFVESLQMVCCCGNVLDDFFETEAGLQFDELVGDDGRVGGPKRAELARVLRHIWKNEPEFKAQLLAEVYALENRIRKQGGKGAGGFKRLYPKQITRKGRPSRSHQDCTYCGCGGDGIKVCGKCSEEGIDGPIIKGTEAVKPTTYTKWS